jgi:hypothetical protein
MDAPVRLEGELPLPIGILDVAVIVDRQALFHVHVDVQQVIMDIPDDWFFTSHGLRSVDLGIVLERK